MSKNYKTESLTGINVSSVSLDVDSLTKLFLNTSLTKLHIFFSLKIYQYDVKSSSDVTLALGDGQPVFKFH